MNECHILFMIENDNEDDIINLYNRFFFFARMFIWKCRREKDKPSLICFLNFLYDEIFYELCVLKARGLDAEKVIFERWNVLVEESDIMNRELF